MNATQAALVTGRLSALSSESPEMVAAALISVEGLAIASCLPDSLPEDLMAAMTAAMLALGERIANDLSRGGLRQVIIEGERGFVLLLAVDQNALLTALASEEANLGLLLLDMRRAAADLRQWL